MGEDRKSRREGGKRCKERKERENSLGTFWNKIWLFWFSVSHLEYSGCKRQCI